MAKIILTVDGTVLKELPLTKERVTIGRRPHNDLIIDHVAISGEHAVIITFAKDSYVEDLNSTNGTQINGQSIKKHLLRDNDVIELEPYKIKFTAGANGRSADAHQCEVTAESEDVFPGGISSSNSDAAPKYISIIKVLNGPSAGKEIALAKPLTTIGRPGIQVAVVSQRKQGYFIAHVEGSSFPLVNGDSIGENARLLKTDDVIDLSGTQMVFRRIDL